MCRHYSPTQVSSAESDSERDLEEFEELLEAVERRSEEPDEEAETPPVADD